jgi:pectin methylesterase-like acyl-CoA thioesterase
MSVLTVQPGQSIQAAIDAANPGDTIDVAAGSYQNQFLTIEKSLTLEAIGGPAVIAATSDPPNGKAIITEGQPGLTVNISGFDISGAVVPDNNGAAIRYEGGTLHLSNVSLHNNQEGLLGAADGSGVITIDHSEIDHNGE